MDDSVMDFLREMKRDLDAQNNRVHSDLSQVTIKIDTLSSSIISLRKENEAIRKENQTFRSEINTLKTQLDNIEGHSHRNNLRISGIQVSTKTYKDVNAIRICDDFKSNS